MENVVFTQLSIQEIRELFRQELTSYFKVRKEGGVEVLEKDEILSIKEASKLLNLSVPTLYGYVQRNAIPVSKKGKKLFFIKQDLINWIKECKKPQVNDVSIDNLLKKGGKP